MMKLIVIKTFSSLKEITNEECKSTMYRRFYYVTPQLADWPRYDPCSKTFYLQPPTDTSHEIFHSWKSMLYYANDIQAALACIEIFCDYQTIRGGKASTVNLKKTSVVRAEWCKTSTASRLKDDVSRAAYSWLMANNETYKQFQNQHLGYLRRKKEDPTIKPFIQTSDLLLHLEGVEVAARPVLYARSSFGDTDIRSRLSALGHLKANQLPSIKTSFMKKYLSRCFDYSRDFVLLCLLYDIALARSLMSIVTIAEKKDMSADAVADHLHNFDSYWRLQQAILEDKCRQLDRLPTLFITIAPAEWKFPLHDPTLHAYKKAKKLSNAQGLLALHFHEVLHGTILLRLFL